MVPNHLDIMLAFLLQLPTKIVCNAVTKITQNEELGEQLIKICISILEKAVDLTETDMDDQLLEVVKQAIVKREEA